MPVGPLEFRFRPSKLWETVCAENAPLVISAFATFKSIPVALQSGGSSSATPTDMRPFALTAGAGRSQHRLGLERARLSRWTARAR